MSKTLADRVIANIAASKLVVRIPPPSPWSRLRTWWFERRIRRLLRRVEKEQQ